MKNLNVLRPEKIRIKQFDVHKVKLETLIRNAVLKSVLMIITGMLILNALKPRINKFYKIWFKRFLLLNVNI